MRHQKSLPGKRLRHNEIVRLTPKLPDYEIRLSKTGKRMKWWFSYWIGGLICDTRQECFLKISDGRPLVETLVRPRMGRWKSAYVEGGGTDITIWLAQPLKINHVIPLRCRSLFTSGKGLVNIRLILVVGATGRRPREKGMPKIQYVLKAFSAKTQSIM